MRELIRSTCGLPVSGVIEGFGEALQLMSVEGHIRVTIPSELAYGEAGAGGASTQEQTPARGRG